MARILVLGCGKLGYPLARRLLDAGHQVSGVSRTPPDSEPSGLRWLSLDVRDATGVMAMPTDFDLVVVILTPAARSPAGYEQIYQQGLGQVLGRFSQASSSPKIVFVSATSVYGQNRGEWVDEDSETAPSTYNGQSLLAAEQSILGFGAGNVVLRFSGIYGEQRNRLLTSLQQPQQIQRTPPLFTNRIHQTDCVNVLYFIAGKLLGGETVPTVVLASDLDPAPKFEMMSWLAHQAGLAPPEPTIAGSGTRQNKRCNNRRLLDMGYRFLYPGYRDGYTAILKTRGETGALNQDLSS